MRLDGRTIALTRPEAGLLADRLVALGATVIHVPLIEVVDASDGSLGGALARLDSFDWLVVTSANGARRVAAVADHPNVRLAAVGPATAAALASVAGRRVDLIAPLPRAEGLLAAFPPAPARVLVAQADRARPVLVDGLVAAGHAVESAVAYRTVSRRPSPDERALLAGADAVVLASGSAATALHDALGAASPPVVAIGPVSADAATSAGLRVTAVASSPDDDGVIAGLAAATP